jgi:hypothetical protein
MGSGGRHLGSRTPSLFIVIQAGQEAGIRDGILLIVNLDCGGEIQDNKKHMGK